MPIRATQCKVCPSRFRLTKIHKPYVGMYKDKPVFHWHYFCPHGHYHFVRYWNEYVNEYFDRVIMLEFSLITYRKDAEKVRELEKELLVAREELDRINDEVRTILGIK